MPQPSDAGCGSQNRLGSDQDELDNDPAADGIHLPEQNSVAGEDHEVATRNGANAERAANGDAQQSEPQPSIGREPNQVNPACEALLKYLDLDNSCNWQEIKDKMSIINLIEDNRVELTTDMSIPSSTPAAEILTFITKNAKGHKCLGLHTPKVVQRNREH